ncbi:alpha-L-rhamnosidase [Cryobacterium sp. 10C3]|uniref:alpha-L-rhamnosidase n=1 Tax=Cryobacterium sp. 10C3 TaxID=3048577 RepID=UPI002AB497CB|nr:family 78 glycoside hydrolase catalytic domain [Cryobacterium sp. 10C3]MDY7557634.1 family 78 glycoside hydrolase catalytic domain [Cryobacterium sp. 10C3]
MPDNLRTVPSISSLRAEGRGRPRFLATGSPALSWQVETDAPGWLQESYELETRVGSRVLSARVASGESRHRAWPADPLPAYSSGEVRVRVTGADGLTSDFSPWLSVETGPLGAADWVGSFIAAGPAGGAATAAGHASDAAESTGPATAADLDSADRGTVRFRTDFESRDGLIRATLSATAHGVYEAVLNGRIVGDEVLTPGWTSCADRLACQTFDVTDLVHAGGPNVVGATVADGWYGERFGFDGNFAQSYPGPKALALQLRLEYADGRIDTVATDTSWTATTDGPVTSAGIYRGENYDARAEDDALAVPGTSFPHPLAVIVLPEDAADPARVFPSFAPPVRRIETRAAGRIFTSRSGATLVDFGQNLVGWLSITVDAPAGHTITLRHAEVLEHGELGVRPLRFARAKDRFTGNGGGPRTWSPRFTFHGFRYAEITNWPGTSVPKLEDIHAVVVHNDLERTGHLETSNPQLNQLHENVVWGMRGNFLSLPTDCPQRDERLGWTGDIQVFAPTASYLYDVSGFLGSWLRDVAAEQERAGGVVPFVVPNPLPMPPMPAAAWGDAATLVPDALFERFGSARDLAAQYPSMRAWVDTVDRLAGANHLWTGGFQFGDWLDPSAPPENPAAAKTDPDIVATAYFFRSTVRLAAAAVELGHTEDAARYARLGTDIRTAFLAEYVTPAGRMMSDAHTAYALAIAFDLVTEPAAVRLAGARLAELVRSHGYRIGTGFVGTPLICDALCRAGQSEVAYRLLLEEGCPSWLYPISMGATTIWERWDSMLPDGSINPGEMTSFNHYALGAVADWMHRTIGGIAPAEPGYRVVQIAPVLGGGLTRCFARLDTGYGPVRVNWTLDGGTFSLCVTIPPNTTARVLLPGAAETIEIGSGRHAWVTDVSALVAVPARPLTLETSLSEIVNDAEARAALQALFTEIGYVIGLGWTSGGRWKSDSPLRSSLIMMPPAGFARVEGLLATLNARP